MTEDLGRVRVLFTRNVADFFEQRQIDIRLHITGRTRIAIPVPGPPDIPAFFDQADIFNTGLAKVRGCQQATETTPHDHHIDFVE